jgi:hypothetical protein
MEMINLLLRINPSAMLHGSLVMLLAVFSIWRAGLGHPFPAPEAPPPTALIGQNFKVIYRPPKKFTGVGNG